MRRIVFVAAVLGIVAAATLGVAPAQAHQPTLANLMPIGPNEAASGASAQAAAYVPLAKPSRVVDTRSGAGGNRRGALRGGHSFAATIAGRGAVPASGVGSVLVSVSGWRATAPGALVVWGAGRRPRTVNVEFAPGAAATNTAVVQLQHGRLQIASTATHGTVQVALDVLGYFHGGSSNAPGSFHPMTAANVLDTPARQAIKPQHTITPRVSGAVGATGSAGSVAVTITALNPATDGALLAATPGSPRPAGSAVDFAAGRSTSAFAILPVSSHRISITNTSARPARVRVDVAGYFSPGISETAGTFRPLDDQRVANHAANRRSTLTVGVAGRAGVPRRGVAAALVTLHAANPASAGTLQAWRAGSTVPRQPAAVSFAAHRTSGATVLVPVSRAGKFAIRNNSAGRVRIQVDVRGYVPATAVPPPDGTASARYLNTLTGPADPNYLANNEQKMNKFGCLDASQGVQFELLDVGAQTVTKPLSATNPGVALALSGGKQPVRLNYADLTDAIKYYINGYVDPSCNKGGTSLRLAIGTNNDGDFQKYPATPRGVDWASKVIDPLQGYAADNGYPVTVVGADDIEAAFASTEAQAMAWENAYLSDPQAQLIVNGDANDCPTQFGRTGRSCAYHWTEQQYYQLAHRGSRIEVLPQIFYPTEAIKWANIDATGGGGLIFVGSLTEYARDTSQLTPAQGRAALYRAISSVVANPDIRFAVDI